MKNNSHYTLSISDLLMGFLFVFILVIMKFIIDYRGGFSRPFIERACLLERFKKEIEKKGIKAEIDKENGILELPEILCFRKSKYKLSKEQKKGLKEVRNIFSRAICYSNLQSGEMRRRWEEFYKGKFEKEKYCSNKKEKHCLKNPDKDGLIDTVLIEGHADSTPIGGIGGGITTNLDLAMKRAQNVFEFLLQYKEATKENPQAKGNYLYALVNNQEKSLFGMTSYGNLRSSIQKNDRSPSSSKEKERCINIRFIMSQTDEIQKDLKKLNCEKHEKKSNCKKGRKK